MLTCPQCEGYGGTEVQLEPPDTYRGPPHYEAIPCNLCDGSGELAHFCTYCHETDHNEPQCEAD